MVNTINFHRDNCSAPLCSKGKDQNNAVWYIGEEICSLKSDFQIRQKSLNQRLKKGYKLDTDRAYKIADLKPTP